MNYCDECKERADWEIGCAKLKLDALVRALVPALAERREFSPWEVSELYDVLYLHRIGLGSDEDDG